MKKITSKNLPFSINSYSLNTTCFATLYFLIKVPEGENFDVGNLCQLLKKKVRTMYKVLKILKDKGLITYDRGVIRLVDEE